MKRVLLIRHGLAGERDPRASEASDTMRPLTAKGRKRLEKIRSLIKSFEIEPEIIATSSLLRAKQTAEIFAKSWKDASIEVWPELSPEFSVEQVAQMIAKNQPDGLALVGHEPMLAELMRYFLSSGKMPISGLKKGSIILLEFPDLIEKGGAQMQFHLNAALLD